jgi:histidyl-tRNA synthetase
MKRPKFQTPLGMHDILPREQKYFEKIYNITKNIADFYNFGKISTPILEQAEIFEKGTGESTDIVQKEMYTLRTKGGDLLALRPEGTPGVVRAYIEHGMASLPQPVKLWYFGPFFRHERPQAGRYREFNSFGYEILGEQNPIIDTQIIQISYNILKELKFKNLIVEINSIGDSQCRPYYKKLLVSYLKRKESLLCQNCKKRLKQNPLRILDCKNEACQKIAQGAPQMVDHLCDECKYHFKEVLESLDETEIPYSLNPYLVRGLDYYTKTVFEIYEDTPEGRKIGALAGGGRYDNLVKLLRGRDTFCCGASGGVERIIDILKIRKTADSYKTISNKVFLAQLGTMAKRRTLKLMDEFKKQGVPIAETLGKNSLKAQLKIADRLGVDYTLILGQKEAIEEVIILREMKTGKQTTIKLNKIVKELKKRLKK